MWSSLTASEGAKKVITVILIKMIMVIMNTLRAGSELVKIIFC